MRDDALPSSQSTCDRPHPDRGGEKFNRDLLFELFSAAAAAGAVDGDRTEVAIPDTLAVAAVVTPAHAVNGRRPNTESWGAATPHESAQVHGHHRGEGAHDLLVRHVDERAEAQQVAPRDQTGDDRDDARSTR